MHRSGRRIALVISFAALASLAVPAFGQDDDWEDWEDDEESGFSFAEYAPEVKNRFLIGLNSLITWPADPVMTTLEPEKQYDRLPSALIKWPAAVGQGILLGVYRAVMGTLDIVFAPLTSMKMLSPEPRFMLFEGVEHDEY